MVQPLVLTSLACTTLRFIVLLFLVDPGVHVHAIKLLPFHPPSKQGLAVEQNVTLSDAMIRVQDTLQQMERRPDCQRLAAKRLAHACVTYDGRETSKTQSTLATLEKLKNAYAIRMTHCALSDAHVPMPSDCLSLLDPDLGADVPTQYLAQCLNALSRDNTMWISLNQVKTEGSIICHSMRIEAEKDEQIHDMNKLFDAVKDIADIVGDSREDLQNYRAIFSELSRNLLADLQLAGNTAESFQATMEEIFRNVIRDATQIREVSSELGENITGIMQHETRALERESEIRRKTYEQSIAMLVDSLAHELNTAVNSVQVAGQSSDLAVKKLVDSHTQLDGMSVLTTILRENLVSAQLQHDAASASTLLNLQALLVLSNESLEATRVLHEDLSHLHLLVSALSNLLQSYLGHFAFWFSVSFLATVILFHHFQDATWITAIALAFPCATATALIFTFVMSPASFLASVMDSHAELFDRSRCYCALALPLGTSFLAGMASLSLLQLLRSKFKRGGLLCT